MMMMTSRNCPNELFFGAYSLSYLFLHGHPDAMFEQIKSLTDCGLGDGPLWREGSFGIL